MRMLMASAALSAGILAFTADGMTEAADFNDASIKGPYSVILSGTITFVKGKPQFLPSWSVGVAEADGAGKIALETVVNISGCVILKQTGTGTYSVNSNGTGQAKVQVTTEPVGEPNAQCPPLDPGLLPENILATLNFTINAEGLDVVEISWEGPTGLVAAIGASGQAKPQVRSSSARVTPK